MYESGSNIRTPTGDKSEWERNLTVSYVVQQGPLKDLSSLRTEVSTKRDSDEHRVIISYPLNIL